MAFLLRSAHQAGNRARDREAFAGRPFRGRLSGMESERRLFDFFPDGVAEVLRPALADGLRFRAFSEHGEGHVSPAAGLVEDLPVGRLVVDPHGF